MLTLIKPKLKPGNHATMNRSQYTVTHGYVNGLGLPVAVVDRRGVSIIINPTPNMGFTGKLVITVFHNYVGGCELNSLSHIQSSPELAKLWGDNHQGLKRDFTYSYEVDYGDVARKGWCYVDEMDIIVTTNFLSPGDVVHPRNIKPIEEILDGSRKGNLMDIYLTGYPVDAVKYTQIGPDVVRLRCFEPDAEPSLSIIHFSNGDGYKLTKISDPRELNKYVANSAEEAKSLDFLRVNSQAAKSEALKVADDVRRKLDKAITEVSGELTDAISNVDRKLDYVDRINKVELEEESLRRKTSADSLKYVSPISKLLMDVLG